ncbi:unnamed protein product (macronuclear) [Paramecium tetraurelia]|uniref:Uncharacterized protein n=1 Tax=Paramecium tetraurelia TaxID=5888 RepID=A0BU32_PARTE|nr:uncharacterized protein GSPATT00032281001 [Paramecium tetraurelia]CAK62049.1 unnamed protein product [Paramecium tetraurelia]|eukprot:XP_001429447.1 hypothetical protein (macronuclear) [Paramecium tetraurelia strain d4-2]
MTELIDKFRVPFLTSLANYKLRQSNDIWINFRKLLQLFEGCEPWIVNVNKWNQYKVWSLLEKPQKLIRLVQNFRVNIQKMHPKNIEIAIDNLCSGDNQYSQYLAALVQYIIEKYEILINEEQIANYLDDSDLIESRMKTQESGLDFQEQPSMDLSCSNSKPNSAMRKSSCTQRSNTTESRNNWNQTKNTIENLQKHKLHLQQQIEQQKEILRELQYQHNKTTQQIQKLSSNSKIDKILNNFNKSRRFVS